MYSIIANQQSVGGQTTQASEEKKEMLGSSFRLRYLKLKNYIVSTQRNVGSREVKFYENYLMCLCTIRSAF